MVDDHPFEFKNGVWKCVLNPFPAKEFVFQVPVASKNSLREVWQTRNVDFKHVHDVASCESV